MQWWKDPEKVKQRAENYKKNFRKKYGVDNPQQLKEIKERTNQTMIDKYGCVGFDGELGKKSKKTIRKKYGVANIMQHEDFKKVGDDNPLRDPIVKKRHKKRMKEYYSEHDHHTKGKSYEDIMGESKAKKRRKQLKESGAYGQSLTPRISKPQLELYKLVKEKYPTAILEYPFLDYCLDIAVPELKLCFEYDGSYWHQDSDKDRLRDEILTKYGWKVTRFVDQVPGKI